MARLYHSEGLQACGVTCGDVEAAVATLRANWGEWHSERIPARLVTLQKPDFQWRVLTSSAGWHGSWHDCLMSGGGAEETKRRHDELMKQCCSAYNYSPVELRAALRGDFGKWKREENLPKPPARDGEP